MDCHGLLEIVTDLLLIYRFILRFVFDFFLFIFFVFNKKKIPAQKASDETKGKKISMETIYTDGACSRNGGMNPRGGIGVYFGDGDARNISEPLTTSTLTSASYLPHTNQRAELAALARALEYIDACDDQHKTFIILSDSEYAIRCISVWATNWKKKGWRKGDGQPVKNIDIIEPAYGRWNRLMSRVRMAHVPREQNTGADALAVAGAAAGEINDGDNQRPQKRQRGGGGIGGGGADISRRHARGAWWL